MFGVTILGNNSALPAYNRHPTSQIISLNDQLFLVDCGEGTQMQMNLYKIRRGKINHIFISHMHGDHYFGLPGLITSMGLLGREADLHLYGPPLLKPIIDLMLEAADTQFGYTLHFHPLEKEGVLLDDAKFSVECFRVFHRIECWGFVFREKKSLRKINKNAIGFYDIPPSSYDHLKAGEDIITESGNVIRNEDVTVANVPGRSYAYCADTLHNPLI